MHTAIMVPADCLEEPESVEVGAHGLSPPGPCASDSARFRHCLGSEAAIGIDPHLVHIHLRKNLADALLGLFDRGDARGMDVVHTGTGPRFEVGAWMASSTTRSPREASNEMTSASMRRMSEMMSLNSE